MATDRDWRKYERQIYERLVTIAGGDATAEVKFDVKLPGRHSGVDRQVDSYVEGEFAGGVVRGTMAVDCKCFTRRVDVKDVEAFVGLVEDVGTNFGLMVTTEGYSAAALSRARAAQVHTEIVPYEDLADWEPEVLFCPVCTDLESEKAPGPLYLDPVPDVPGRNLATGVGRCWTCDAISMRCSCGHLNSLYESDEGKWIDCEAGCGVEWFVEVEVDRKGVPEGEHLAFRRHPDGDVTDSSELPVD